MMFHSSIVSAGKLLWYKMNKTLQGVLLENYRLCIWLHYTIPSLTVGYFPRTACPIVFYFLLKLLISELKVSHLN